jgi:transposase-like protein
MRRKRPALFKGRHFEAEIIVLCVRWYLRYPLSLRQLEEMMSERNLSVDHVTIWRWVSGIAARRNTAEAADRALRQLQHRRWELSVRGVHCG